MKNLSSETCIRLRDAGFPQPKKAIGQFWYVDDALCVIHTKYGACMRLDGIGGYGAKYDDYGLFCPTALELLAMLPDWELRLSGEIGKWILSKERPFPFNSNWHAETAESIGERLAEIWLSENYKPV